MIRILSRTRRTRVLSMVLVCLLVPGLEVVDYLSGDVTLAAFYLVPVALASWFHGRVAGFVVAFVCAAAGLTADYLLPHPPYHDLPAALFNAMTRLAVYVFSAWLLATISGILDRQRELIEELRVALDEVKTLRELLPICAWCKRIRDEKSGDEWKAIEQYLTDHAHAEFTHGICPSCATRQFALREGNNP